MPGSTLMALACYPAQTRHWTAAKIGCGKLSQMAVWAPDPTGSPNLFPRRQMKKLALSQTNFQT